MWYVFDLIFFALASCICYSTGLDIANMVLVSGLNGPGAVVDEAK
jgi:hypothetical protein